MQKFKTKKSVNVPVQYTSNIQTEKKKGENNQIDNKVIETLIPHLLK